MSISQAIGRLAKVRTQFGLSAMFQWMFDRAAARLLRFQSFEIVWLEVDNLGDLSHPGPEFEFRFLDAHEVEQFAADPSNDLDSSMADRIRAGADLCFAALDGDRLAAYGWYVGSSRVDLQACKLEYSIVSPK